MGNTPEYSCKNKKGSFYRKRVDNVYNEEAYYIRKKRKMHTNIDITNEESRSLLRHRKITFMLLIEVKLRRHHILIEKQQTLQFSNFEFNSA